MTTPENMTTQADANAAEELANATPVPDTTNLVAEPIASEQNLKSHVDVDRRFLPHLVSNEASELMDFVKDGFRHLAHLVVEHVPEGSARTAAIDHLEHAVAAIARAEV